MPYPNSCRVESSSEASQLAVPCILYVLQYEPLDDSPEKRRHVKNAVVDEQVDGVQYYPHRGQSN